MKICVIGTGTMGSGIVQSFAQAGIPVVMKSRSDASNEKALARISNQLTDDELRAKCTYEIDNSGSKSIEAQITEIISKIKSKNN